MIPTAVREALAEHARGEAPNEACGLILLDGDRAVRYEPGINAQPSPYRFELRMPDPEIWFAADEGLDLAIFHSHLTSPPRPSRTDVENIGQWRGLPYVIYTLRTDELAAWRITDGGIEPLPLEETA